MALSPRDMEVGMSLSPCSRCCRASLLLHGSSATAAQHRGFPTALAIKTWDLLWDSHLCLQNKTCAPTSECCSCPSLPVLLLSFPSCWPNGVPGGGDTAPQGCPPGTDVSLVLVCSGQAPAEEHPQQRTLHTRLWGCTARVPPMSPPAFRGRMRCQGDPLHPSAPSQGLGHPSRTCPHPCPLPLSVPSPLYPPYVPHPLQLHLLCSKAARSILGGSSKRCTQEWGGQQGWEGEKRPWGDQIHPPRSTAAV